MIRNVFSSWQGFLTAVIVIGLIAWIIHNPSHAGTTAANLVSTVVGWGEKGISAVATFTSNLSS